MTVKQNAKAENILTWHGTDLRELSRDELLDIIGVMYRENENSRRAAHESLKLSIESLELAEKSSRRAWIYRNPVTALLFVLAGAVLGWMIAI